MLRCAQLWRVIWVASLLSLPAARAVAQDDPPPDRQPIRRFAADARLSLPRFKPTAAQADEIDVTLENLPARGFGIGLAAHVYPLRIGRATVGVGGEWMSSRRSRTLEPAVEGGPEGPTVTTRFSTVAPQVSLNFGASEGWSYISGGLGWSTLSVRRDAQATGAGTGPDAPRLRTINYGAGARWFAQEHVALSIDLRFYRIAAPTPSATAAAIPGTTLMVFGVGVGFK